MNTSLIRFLRLAPLAVASLLSCSPVSANAYTSSGADGLFQPVVSMYLDTGHQQIFNFTDIYIPSGVTINIAGPSSSLPFILLATGNVDIAGGINIGMGNSLWIETPGRISLSGTMNADWGSSLTLVSSVVDVSGVVNMPGGGITLNSGGINTSGDYLITDLTGLGIVNPGSGVLVLSPVPEPEVWAMLAIGLFVIFTALRLRNQNVCMA